MRQLTGRHLSQLDLRPERPNVSGVLDGTQGTLSADGKTIFPYLNGPVTMDTGTYGYEATPLATQATGASFDTLVSGPNGSALVGVYTHANGVQEMVETFNENQYQLQAELLRHGALDWVTRGVYFGDQRNYLEAHVDDNFLSDDSWDTTTHINRLHPGRRAPRGSRRRRIRREMVGAEQLPDRHAVQRRRQRTVRRRTSRRRTRC